MWKSHALFKGVQISVLIGDPAKEGLVVQRIKLAAGSETPPHRHTYSEVVTVISGTVGLGLSEKFERAPEQVLEAGSVAAIPANQYHFTWTADNEAVIQTQFIGPANIDVMGSGK